MKVRAVFQSELSINELGNDFAPGSRRAKAQRRPGSSRARCTSRRGVSSVLSMMFLVLFSSLAAAMAVVSQGNLRTADSHQKVSRAMSAAETGLTFAAKRLASESKRFVVKKGVIDATYAEQLWLGTYDEAATGTVTVLPPTGYVVNTPPDGIAYAVRDAHLADSDDVVLESGDNSLPSVNNQTGTLLARPISLSANAGGPFFRLKYELIDNQPAIRVTSQGIDDDVTRTLQMDFVLNKKIKYAVISPNRIMIGKNVRIEGPLGSRYGIVAGELNSPNGDPLVMRSDFYYLNAQLTTWLDTFFTQVRDYDVDGDNRLRPDHAAEAAGLNGHAELHDENGDEFVDDFDLFLEKFDQNSDHKVVYSDTLAAAAGLGALPVEFTAIDDQLARLIDNALPDRDGDGDVDSRDTELGYHDGVIDANDTYAKVHGSLAFAVARAPWDAANGASYQTIVRGAVEADSEDEAPVAFEVGDEDLREITTEMLDSSQTWFHDAVQSSTAFQTQVNNAIAQGGTYTAPSNATWESVPYNAAGAYDFYQRAIYSNMTFTNVKIPKGNNALFNNCKFIGVTFVDTQTDCTDVDWNYAGALDRTGTAPNYTYVLKFPQIVAQVGSTIIPDTRTESNNLRFNNCTFLGSISGDKPTQYTHWRNKMQFTGTTRFFVDPNDPDLDSEPDAATLRSELNGISASNLAELQKSSILLPGWSVDVGNFTNEQNADPTLTPKVKLRGTIVAGIIDVRGTADVHGTLLMTYRPVASQGPLNYGGLPDAFNTTIGYFGPADGDSEGVDPASASFTGFGEISLRYDPDAKLPDGIPWPVGMEPLPLTYNEGGAM